MPYGAKCISLPARPSEPNDWRFFGNRDYVISLSRCHWVRLWVIWSDIDLTAPPTDVYGQWSRYHSHPHFLALDEQIADANANGVAVLLSMSQYSPTWANGATGPQSGTGKDARTRFPSNVDLGSPWERFLSYCYNRYRAHFDGGVWHGWQNSTGPNSSQPYGNPRSAWISGLGIVNEPNFENWQDYMPGCTAAKMMQTVDTAISYWNGVAPSPACALFAPDTSDTPYESRGGVQSATDYLTCTNQVLDQLANWRPVNYWVWSHHNYQDVKNGNDNRLNAVRQALIDKNWRGGGDRYVYVTESGWSMGGSYANETTQKEKVVTHWNRTRNADFRMGTQHLIRNDTARTNIVVHTTDRKLPLWTSFQNLQPRRP
jgi:hypothetical protein